MKMGDAETPLLLEEGDDEMEQAKAWKALQFIQLSVDLESAAHSLMSLLRHVDSLGSLYADEVLEKSIERYTKCWLQIARDAKEEDGMLLPPLDVRWVWLCHRLSPEDYAEDCETVCGRLIDSPLFDPRDENDLLREEEAEARCREIWNRRYPQNPFDLPDIQRPKGGRRELKKCSKEGCTICNHSEQHNEAVGAKGSEEGTHTKELAHVGSKDPEAQARGSRSGSPPGSRTGVQGVQTTAIQGESRNGESRREASGMVPDLEEKRVKYDLEAAVERQSTFFFQVSRPWMLDDSYLRGSVQRYKMFLNLILLNNGAFCVPTFDIDLLWHAHQMCAKAYSLDTQKLFGRVLGHDDRDSNSEKTGSARSKRLEWGYRTTMQLWDRTYGVPYDRAGAMLRASPPVFIPPAPLMVQQRMAEMCSVSGQEINAAKGLKTRMTFEAHVMVWEVAGLGPPPPGGENMFVEIRAMNAAAKFSRKTFSLQHAPGWPAPEWRHRWVMECEQETTGLHFELKAETKGFWTALFGSRSFGSASLEWRQVFQTPALFLDRQVALSHLLTDLTGKPGDRPPRLRVSVSTTAPAPGPYLLRSFFMRGTDDNGAMISEEFLCRQNFRPQVGRWVSRTVVDHRDREVFVVRRRVATGTWEGSAKRPKPAPLKERVIVVHKGGWSYVRPDDGLGAIPESEPPHLRLGIVKGPIVAQAVPQLSENPEVLQQFCLLGCSRSDDVATLTVRREAGNLIFVHGLELDLVDASDVPAKLVPGRHFQYTVPEALPSDELGFVTLVRYTSDAPRGKATALFNWRGSAMEVAPEESAVLVLLICICVSEAISDMVMINRVRRFRKVFLPYPDESIHWGAMTTSAEKKASDAALETRRAQQEFEFCSLEEKRVKWWNRRPLKWASGAGNCGAGACGPSMGDDVVISIVRN